MGRPPKTQGRDVRALLLDEAVRVISETGEQSVRTKAIAAAVGVTEPALFHYFGSREGLIEEAQATRFEMTQVDVLVKFRKAAMKCSNAQEFAGVVVATLHDSFGKNRMRNRAARFDITGSAVSRPQLRARLAEAQERAIAPLIDTMEYARVQKWIKQDLDSEAFAYWIVAQISGRYFAELEPKTPVLDGLSDIVLRAVLNELELSEYVTGESSKK